MSALIAIDPGAATCAVATFVDRELVSVESINSLQPHTLSFGARAVYELPQADGRSVPADDLLAVAIAGAQLAAWCSLDVGVYTPRQWKGGVPKPIHHRRAWAVLKAAEKAILGGAQTELAIEKACERGAADRWRKGGARYYSARDLPTVEGTKITHDLLDAAALGLYDLGRLEKA